MRYTTQQHRIEQPLQRPRLPALGAVATAARVKGHELLVRLLTAKRYHRLENLAFREHVQQTTQPRAVARGCIDLTYDRRQIVERRASVHLKNGAVSTRRSGVGTRPVAGYRRDGRAGGAQPQ